MDTRRDVWSEREMESLINNVSMYKDIVFGAKSTTVSQAQKRETWDRISKNINIENPTTTLRPTVSVRKKWENLLGIAKKDIKTYKKSLAGEGPPSFYLKPLYRKIWTEVYGGENPSLPGGLIQEQPQPDEPCSYKWSTLINRVVAKELLEGGHSFTSNMQCAIPTDALGSGGDCSAAATTLGNSTLLSSFRSDVSQGSVATGHNPIMQAENLRKLLSTVCSEPSRRSMEEPAVISPSAVQVMIEAVDNSFTHSTEEVTPDIRPSHSTNGLAEEGTRQRKRKSAFVFLEEQEERERLKTEEQRLKNEEQRLKNEEQRLKNQLLKIQQGVSKVELAAALVTSRRSLGAPDTEQDEVLLRTYDEIISKIEKDIQEWK